LGAKHTRSLASGYEELKQLGNQQVGMSLPIRITKEDVRNEPVLIIEIKVVGLHEHVNNGRIPDGERFSAKESARYLTLIEMT
jgi:hypothetical protein